MKRTQYTLFLALLLFWCLPGFQGAFAQSIARSVVGSAGDTQTHPDFGSLHWTVGEPVVETIQQSPVRLTQGFHQTYYDLVVEVEDGPKKPNWAVKLYPNPTTELVTLETTYTGNLHVAIVNLNGQALYTQEISGGGVNTFDLKDHPAGTYLLSLRDAGQNIQTFKILKIRL